MFAPLPFALQASAGCPPAAELALSLAASFHAVDAELVDAAFADLAYRVELSGSDRGDPVAELRSLADLRERCPMLQSGGPMGYNALLLDRALLDGNADPLVIAVALVEIARRVGVPLGIVSNGVDHCVGRLHCDEPVVLRACDGALVDARCLEGTLCWRCPHEVCGQLIDELELRWERSGHIAEAIRTAELRLCLPFEPDCVERAALRLEGLRARLN